MTDRALRFALIAVTASGAAIAAYLTVLHYRGGAPVCVSGGCETVQHSRYAELVGVPVSTLGLAMFAVLLASAFLHTRFAIEAAAALAGAAVLFAVYLVVLQVAVIHALCIWCVAADALAAAAATLAALRLRQVE